MSKVERVTAALADRYEIEHSIGEGGMATVYLAKDLKHQRNVAVKVLKPELAAVLGGERFLHEITVTANLQHPHILQLYDSGEADTFLYYVMPHVEGETLRDKLNRERQLSIDEAVSITTAVASALDYAHKRGVVHRDIKPENVLLQDGVAMMADFGIALAVTSAGGDRLTETGLSLGTPAYMSPEQVAGHRDLDARSDVYSLACVTYEMLAGDPPFVASAAQAVMAKHVTDPPPPVTTTRPGISLAIARALDRALHKAPADRYETAGVFAIALTAEVPNDERTSPTVVVLPFLNRSGEVDDEYFSDGLTDEVIADLSRVSALRVISRNSAMMLKGTTKDARTLAQELGVTHLVTGTVRRAGTALRVTADLVDAATDVPIWSEKFAGTMGDVFGIQEEIARQIAAALEVTLTFEEEQGVAERPFDDPATYDFYLKARQVMYTTTPDDLHRAVQLVDNALGIAGDSALLLATKANCFWGQFNFLHADTLDRASELVEQALVLDPACYLAIYVRGLVAGSRGQPLDALKDTWRAHELRPNDPHIAQETLRFMAFTGAQRYTLLLKEWLAMNPLDPIGYVNESVYEYIAGRPEDGADPGRRALALVPDSSAWQFIVGWPIAVAGFHDEAIDIFDRFIRSAPEAGTKAIALFLKSALECDEAAVERSGVADLPPERMSEYACRLIADGYAFLDQRDAAVRWLRISADRGFIHYPHLRSGGFSNRLHDEAEFQALLEEVKPRWEAVIEWERELPGGH